MQARRQLGTVPSLASSASSPAVDLFADRHNTSPHPKTAAEYRHFTVSIFSILHSPARASRCTLRHTGGCPTDDANSLLRSTISKSNEHILACHLHS